MIFDRHSDLIDRTNRSAYAFRFGLRAGSLTVPTPQHSPGTSPTTTPSEFTRGSEMRRTGGRSRLDPRAARRLSGFPAWAASTIATSGTKWHRYRSSATEGKAHGADEYWEHTRDDRRIIGRSPSVPRGASAHRVHALPGSPVRARASAGEPNEWCRGSRPGSRAPGPKC